MPYKRRRTWREKKESSVRRIAKAGGLSEGEVQELARRFKKSPSQLWGGYQRDRVRHALGELARAYGKDVEEMRRIIEARRQRRPNVSAGQLWRRVALFEAAGERPPAFGHLFGVSLARIERRLARKRSKAPARTEVQRLLGEERFQELLAYRQRMRLHGGAKSVPTVLPLLQELRRRGVDLQAVSFRYLLFLPAERMLAIYDSRRILGEELCGRIEALRRHTPAGMRKNTVQDIYASVQRLQALGMDPRKIPARDLLFLDADTLVQRHIPRLPAGEIRPTLFLRPLPAEYVERMRGAHPKVMRAFSKGFARVRELTGIDFLGVRPRIPLRKLATLHMKEPMQRAVEALTELSRRVEREVGEDGGMLLQKIEAASAILNAALAKLSL